MDKYSAELQKHVTRPEPYQGEFSAGDDVKFTLAGIALLLSPFFAIALIIAALLSL